MKRYFNIVVLFFAIFFSFQSNAAQKSDLEGLLFILEEANERGEEIDYNVASKQYGFKNFKDFVKSYSKEYEVEGLTVKQAKEFLKSSDDTTEIIESQENLDKLYSLILNNKHFKKKIPTLKFLKKGNTKVIKSIKWPSLPT